MCRHRTCGPRASEDPLLIAVPFVPLFLYCHDYAGSVRVDLCLGRSRVRRRVYVEVSSGDFVEVAQFDAVYKDGPFLTGKYVDWTFGIGAIPDQH